MGLVFMCLMGMLNHTTQAQQTIINMPSADLTPKDRYFILNESFLRSGNQDSEWKTTNFFTYGLSNNTELAITSFNAGLPKTDNLTVAYGFKSVFPVFNKRFPARELKLTTGYMLPLSKQGRGVGSYGYTHFSGRFPKLRTRLSAGINAGTHQIFERDVVSFMGAIEHPITPSLQAVLEYYSGTHAFAGAIAGLVYHNHKHDLILVGGWRIPNNQRSGNSGLVVEIGKFFGPIRKKPKEL